MRDILFRGKRVKDETWVEGYYIQANHNWHPHGIHKDWIACGASANGGWFTLLSRYAVHPSTVGQYTGLTDKNGKKIFEGDIVESQYTQREYLVCFGPYTYQDEYEEEQEAFGWYNQDINGCITAFGCPEIWATVIGNIHDNQELIGGNDG